MFDQAACRGVLSPLNPPGQGVIVPQLPTSVYRRFAGGTGSSCLSPCTKSTHASCHKSFLHTEFQSHICPPQQKYSKCCTISVIFLTSNIETVTTTPCSYRSHLSLPCSPRCAGGCSTQCGGCSTQCGGCITQCGEGCSPSLPLSS